MGTLTHKAARAAYGTAIDAVLKHVKKDREKGLLELVDLTEKYMGDNFQKENYEAARKMIQDPDNKWVKYVNHMIDELDPYVIRQTALNLGYEAAFYGTKTIREMRKKYDCNIPWLILMDPTSACNLHCTGCWAAEYGKRLNLTYNDLDSVKALVTDKTCAIILEPLQGEGGINAATEEFMKGIRELCDEEGILMICDEVQCGMGRTGAMFAWQAYDIKPDIMSTAKAIGSGIPVGAFAMTEEVAKYSLEPGDHGTTYGGNPLACTAVSKTIEIFEKKHLVEHVQKVGAYLTKKLEELVEEYDTVKAVKGKGLMQGIQVTKPISEITGAALKEGLLIIGAGSDVIRFVPPLIIELEQVDEMIRILKKAL